MTSWFFARGPLPGHQVLQVPPEFSGIEVVTQSFVDDAHAQGLAVWVWFNGNDDDSLCRLAASPRPRRRRPPHRQAAGGGRRDRRRTGACGVTGAGAERHRHAAEVVIDCPALHVDVCERDRPRHPRPSIPARRARFDLRRRGEGRTAGGHRAVRSSRPGTPSRPAGRAGLRLVRPGRLGHRVRVRGRELMDTRRIGGLDVSVVGLGCNNFGMRIDADQSRAVVDAALDAGINYFDTAEAYGGGASEEFLGAALAGRRDSALIATKWGMRPAEAGAANGSRAAVRAAVEGSLRRLGTDHIDHYQLHNPDPTTPIGDTLEALAELVAEGTVREIGCSNFSAAQLDEAAAAAGSAGLGMFASVQNHYSLLTRDPESNGVLDACGRHEVGFVPYFPLESGVLTGKYRRGEPPPEGTRLAAWGDRAGSFLDDDRLARVEAVSEWADTRGRSVVDAAVSWLLAEPTVRCVISGATRPQQVVDNAAAADWSITADERAELSALVVSPPPRTG
ncbi:MAG: aldo/keto reductase [Acidimicrobiales bacterium]